MRLAELMEGKRKNKVQESNLSASDVIPNVAGASTLKALNQNIEDEKENQQLAQDADQISTPLTTHHSPRLTYHDACHLAHGQGIRAQPRALLGLVPDIEIVPLPESEMCCGSAGTYNITQPEMAMQLLHRKMKNIEQTKAQTVVTGNPGCAMQIALGAKKFGVDVDVRHPIEVLDEATEKGSKFKA